MRPPRRMRAVIGAPIAAAASSLSTTSGPLVAISPSDSRMSPVCKPGLRRRSVRCDRMQHHGRAHVELRRIRHPARQRHRVDADAEPGAVHAAMAQDLADHEAHRVAGDRKADALRAADHRGVDADDSASRRHQRAAGIAGIERGVGLDHVLDRPAAARGERTAERRDDAGRDGGIEAERVADRHRDLAAPAACCCRRGSPPAGRRHAP